MRYLLRSSLSVLLAFCMVFSNLSSAIANTTTDQSYDIMPISIPSNRIIQFTPMYYFVDSDSWVSAGSSFNLEDNNTQTLRTVYYYSEFDTRKLYPGYKITISHNGSLSLGYSYLYSFRLLFDKFRFLVGIDEYQYDLSDSSIPFQSFVSVDYNFTYFDKEGVKQYGESVTYSTPIDVNSFDYRVGYYGNASKGSSVDFVIGPYDASSRISDLDYLVGGSIDSITLYVCYQLTDNNFLPDLENSPSIQSLGTTHDYLRFVTGIQDSAVSFIPSLNGKYNNSNSYISNVTGSLNRNISSVKSSIESKITSSTNTLTNKLNTMSDSISSGLSNLGTTINNKLENVKTAVVNKVTEVKDSVVEVKDSIIDLPNKLEEKALSLIVPEQEVIESKFSEIEDLLRGRFGLIYQAEEVIVDFANSLQTSTATTEASGGKIIFPSVVINLPDETAFNFGGYEVDLIPDGFETLANAVRLAVNMVCTAIFINMCKNKLEVIFK